MIRASSETDAADVSQRPELIKEVDADLDAFSGTLQANGGDPLAKPERAILKTYLAWKLGVALNALPSSTC